MRKNLILSAVAALAVGGTAQAEGLSYNYAQADLLGSRLSDSSGHENGSGIGFNGSVEVIPHLYGAVDFGTDKYSNNGLSLRFTSTSIGAGGYLALGPMVDFFGGASLERVKLKVSGGGDSESDSEDGWGLTAGVRGVLAEKWQWNTSLKYRDVGDFKSIVSFTVGGRYYFTPALALGLDLTSQKYDKDFLDIKEGFAALNFRYDFGSRR